MSTNLAVQKSPKVVHIARGPLDEPGFTFTSTGLDIDPDVSYERWERYGRKLQLAEKGIQWALGDWVIFGEGKFKERATQAVEFTGLKVKTLQNYATVAKKIDKSRRRDSDIVDFSTHSEVAMLPEDDQERILAKAQESPADFSRQDARKEAKRAKRRLRLVPDELDLLHDPEVQTFLGDYVEALQKIDAVVPSSAMFLHGMIQSHIGQAQWQKDRTIESDYGAILDTFDEAYTQTDQHIFKHLTSSGHFISDPDLDVRLETMARHSILVAEAQESKTKHICDCKPEHKQLTRVPPGGKQDTRRGDMGPDLYMLYDQPTGDAANVNHAQSRYDSGERE